jgi:hypothetical protein
MKNRYNKIRPKDLHCECYDILLTKKELKNQLWNNWCQSNLLRLLSNKDISNEEKQRLLLMLGIKFEQISGFFYAGKGQKKKLLAKEYGYILFDAFIDSIEECMDRLNTTEIDFAKNIYQKYVVIKNYLVPLLSMVDEQYYASEFANIINHVLLKESFSQGEFEKIPPSVFSNITFEEFHKFDYHN